MRVTARAAVDAIFTAQALVTAALLMEEESQSQGHLSALGAVARDYCSMEHE